VIILALVISIAYSLQRQASSSMEGKVMEAGLIESGGSPALYFNLRNTTEKHANYTYVIEYNSTDRGLVSDRSSISIAPSQTFYYTVVLIRPSQGVMVLNLRIYRGGDTTREAPLYNQSWIIMPQA